MHPLRHPVVVVLARAGVHQVDGELRESGAAVGQALVRDVVGLEDLRSVG